MKSLIEPVIEGNPSIYILIYFSMINWLILNIYPILEKYLYILFYNQKSFSILSLLIRIKIKIRAFSLTSIDSTLLNYLFIFLANTHFEN